MNSLLASTPPPLLNRNQKTISGGGALEKGSEEVGGTDNYPFLPDIQIKQNVRCGGGREVE
jgi:hypothetical protein